MAARYGNVFISPLKHSFKEHCQYFSSLSSRNLGTAQDLPLYQWALNNVSFGFHIWFPNLNRWWAHLFIIRKGSFRCTIYLAQTLRWKTLKALTILFLKREIKCCRVWLWQTSTFLNIVPSCILFFFKLYFWTIWNSWPELAVEKHT